MHLTAADGTQGWNTLPVTLVAGPKVEGAPAKSKPPAEEPSAALTRPLRSPHPSFASPRGAGTVAAKWSLRTLVLLALMVAYAVCDAKMGLGSRLGSEFGQPAKVWRRFETRAAKWLDSAMMSEDEREAAAQRKAERKAERETQAKLEKAKLAAQKAARKAAASGSKPPAELAEARDLIDGLDRKTLYERLVQAGADVDDDMSLEELRALAASEISKSMVQEAAADAAKSMTPEQKTSLAATRRKKALQRKSDDELRMMLLALGETFHEENATTEDLRQLARETDAMSRWDALPPTEKLKWNQKLALHNAKKQDAKAAYDRQVMREAQEARQTEQGNVGDMPNMKPLPEWEIEWGPTEEEEALERLRQLPLWKMLDAPALEKMMSTIRGNPKFLDSLEQESMSQRTIAEMMGPNGEMPDAQALREAGLNLKMQKF